MHLVQNLFLMLNCSQQRVEIVRVSVWFFFSDPELIHDRIFAIQSPVREGPETSAPVFPPSPVRLRRGERADFLSQFTRAVGGDVILNRKKHTTGVHLFAGSKALKTHTCTALLDTGSPASFIQKKVGSWPGWWWWQKTGRARSYHIPSSYWIWASATTSILRSRN